MVPALLRAWLLGDRGSVGTWVSCSKVDLAAAVADDSCPLAYRKGEGFEQSDLVAPLREAITDVGRDGLLHLDIATLKGSFREAGLFERSLDVHTIVNNVGDELRVGLSLVPAAHDAEADMDLALLHEGRDDGVERPLMSGEGVRQAGSELKDVATALKREAESWGDKTSAIAGIVALNERDNVAVLVDG